MFKMNTYSWGLDCEISHFALVRKVIPKNDGGQKASLEFFALHPRVA